MAATAGLSGRIGFHFPGLGAVVRQLDGVPLRDGAPLRAAFGPSPGADVWRFARSPDARQRWLAAVVLGGQGHYAAAAAILTRLLSHPDPVLASLAASTLGSHRRQLGAHAAARPLDGLALRLARSAGQGNQNGQDSQDSQDGQDGEDRAGASVDALIGLAADAVGLGRLEPARRLLAMAHHEATGGASWRSVVRLGWLAAEVELAAGRAAGAIEPARLALAEAGRRGAVRHVAKSELVLAAALAAAGRPEEARPLLQDVTDLGHRHGLVPLTWPARLLLAELPADPAAAHAAGHLEQAEVALGAVFRRADAPLRAAAARSPWVRSDMLRTGDSAERSSVGEIRGEYVIGTCQGSTPRDR